MHKSGQFYALGTEHFYKLHINIRTEMFKPKCSESQFFESKGYIKGINENNISVQLQPPGRAIGRAPDL